MSKNDITGDSIITKNTTDKYRDGWDRIFGKKKSEEALEEMAEIAQKTGQYEE